MRLTVHVEIRENQTGKAVVDHLTSFDGKSDYSVIDQYTEFLHRLNGQADFHLHEVRKTFVE